MLTSRQQLEVLAATTWELLRHVRDLHVRFGEESITDILMLSIARARADGSGTIRAHPVERAVEAATGVDWLMILNQPFGQALYAVQAKKLCPDGKTYSALKHRVKGTNRLQHEALESFAGRSGFTPIYCLFNWLENPRKWHWHCREDFDPPQLGITAAPLDVVKQAIDVRGGRTFQSIHQDRCVQPWRCLLHAPPGDSGPAKAERDGPEARDNRLVLRILAELERLDAGTPIPSSVFADYEADERPNYVMLVR